MLHALQMNGFVTWSLLKNILKCSFYTFELTTYEVVPGKQNRNEINLFAYAPSSLLITDIKNISHLTPRNSHLNMYVYFRRDHKTYHFGEGHVAVIA